MAELTLMKTAAEQQLAAEWQAAKAQAARRGAAARGRVRALRRDRPAAPARRGVEIHRSARADARRQAAGEPAGRRREGARQGCRRAARRRRAAGGSCSSMARSCPSCPISPTLRRASTHPPDGAGARGGDALVHEASRQGGHDRRSGGRAQHRLHGRRHRDPCRGRRRSSSGRSIWCSPQPASSRLRCSRARSSWSRRARARCWSRATRAPTAATIRPTRRSRWSSATRRMSITSRSRARAARRCTCRR